eukprot:gene4957-5198_t
MLLMKTLRLLLLFPIVVAAQQLTSMPRQIEIPNPRPRDLTYQVTPDFTGGLSTVAIGLQPARLFPGNLSGNFPLSLTTVKVPPGPWTFLRFALFSDDIIYEGKEPDLDMAVYEPTNLDDPIDSSSSLGNNEWVDIFMPTSTSYVVAVVNFDGGDTLVEYKLNMWMLTQPGPASSNFRSAPPFNRPAQATTGTDVNVTLTFSDRVRSPSQKWLGMVGYKAHLPGMTAQQLSHETLVWLVNNGLDL